MQAWPRRRYRRLVHVPARHRCLFPAKSIKVSRETISDTRKVDFLQNASISKATKVPHVVVVNIGAVVRSPVIVLRVVNHVPMRP
jgi:hypothetical protein